MSIKPAPTFTVRRGNMRQKSRNFFVDLWLKLSTKHGIDPLVTQAGKAVARDIVEAEKRLKDRSDKHKEERENGARVTRHRISI